MPTQLNHPPDDPARVRSRPDPRLRTRPASGWFRAFWRWHFYASFLVAPVLLVLAVTGLTYLLRFQIEPLLHGDLIRVDKPAGALSTLPYNAQLQAARTAFPDHTVVSMTEPGAEDRSTVFSTTLPDGSARDVYVDPWSAEVLGALNPDTTLSGYAVRIHGELMAGRWGDYLIELAACWAIVMAITGYYLFLKGRRARSLRRSRGAPGARLRSTHARLGAITGAGLLLLLVSGLPWTSFWGGQAQRLATDRGSSLWSDDPGALSAPTSRLDESLPHSHAQDVPWAMGASPVPTSTPPASAERSIANLDTAVAVAERARLRHPMTVVLPGDEKGVFSVIGYAFHAPSQERTVHVDQYGGRVVSTYGFADYPLLAKVVAQGIGLHEGRSLGWVSFWGAFAMCGAVIASCVTGPVMWWRRRPAGRQGLAAPRGRLPLRGSPLLLAGLVLLGVLLPFFGISVLLVLVLDQLLLRRVRALGDWFGTV